MYSSQTERQGQVGDLKRKTRSELHELLLRQEKLLSNRRFLKSLPDGGRKISDFAERVRLAISDCDEEEQKQSMRFSAGTELQSKYQQAFSMQRHHGVHDNSGISPQNRPGEGAAATAAICLVQEMDTSHTGHPRVTDEAQETADAGLSVDSNVTLESDLVQALGKVTLSDTSSGRDSKGASLNSNADTDNVFLRKQPPLKPHYLEIFERNEGISDHRKQRFKPNQLPSRVDPHSSSESLPTGDSPRRASPLSAQARKEMDRKHLDDITAARQAPLRHDPAQLLSLKESAELLREQSRKHQEIQSRVAAQKLSEALKVSMGSFIADTGPMAAYREVQDDPAQLSSEED